MSDPRAIGITNQGESVVVWDRSTGQPVHNTIVWQDRRTAPYCDDLRARDGLEEKIRAKTGLVIAPYFSGTKVKWMLDNVPGLRSRAERGEIAFGTIDSWLVWQLTGGKAHITDYSNASRTLLYNIHELTWDAEILEMMDIPASILPEVKPSSHVYGETELEMFFGTHSIPVAGIAGDQQAALFGQACYGEGLAKNTYGTGSFVLMNTGTEAVRSKEKLLTTIAWGIGDEPVECALEGAIFVTGAAVQWLRDGLGLVKAARETEGLARSLASNDEVYFVPALVGLGAPHWDPYARGMLIGITPGDDVGACRPRRAREHVLPDPRRRAGDAARRGHPAQGAARRRRRLGQRLADAVPGRHPRRAGRGAAGDGDDGARLGLSRGARHRILGEPRRARREVAARPPLRAEDARERARAALPALGHALERARGWALDDEDG